LLSSRITSSIRTAGLSPIWICHRDAQIEEANGADVIPSLSVSLYDAYSGTAPSRVEAFVKRLGRARRRLFGVTSDAHASAVKFADELSGAVKRLGLTSKDRLLLHTADGISYAALDAFMRSTPFDKLPNIHVCTPYDPAGVMPNRVPGHPINVLVKRWHAAGLLDEKLYLYGENSRLADHLSTLWEANVRALHLPAIDLPDADGPEAHPWPHTAKLRIVHLGPARLEKGFHLLPAIVKRVQESLALTQEDLAAPPVSFTFQASPQIVGYAPAVTGAIEELRQFPSTFVRLIEDTMSEADYVSLLHSSNVALLPYGLSEYRYRSSGIVSEALSMDKVLVATKGTYPASVLQSGGGLAGSNPEELGDAIVEIMRNLPSYLEGAALQGQAYRTENHIDRYLQRCLDAEKEAPSTPKKELIGVA